MDSRARAFRATVIKLGAFATVMILVLVGLVMVFSRYQPGSTNSYSAIFTSASAIKGGSKVQIAGVDVGVVNSVGVTRDNLAEVEFTVNQDYRLPSNVRALIRYQNLTGDRYLELQRGTGETGDYLADGAQIPVEQTEPALDLDNLLGGFKPLFRTLDGEQINQLSAALIDVFQGQGPALNTLLADTASFTSTLADRDALIGAVIDNLNETLATLEADHDNLDTSVDSLQQLVTGLAGDRDIIGETITASAKVTNGIASLLDVTRPDIKESVTNLGTVSQEALNGEDFLRAMLPQLPGDFKTLSNLGSYGAWLQIYFCRIRLRMPGPGDSTYWFTALDVMGDTTRAGGRCAA